MARSGEKQFLYETSIIMFIGSGASKVLIFFRKVQSGDRDRYMIEKERERAREIER